MPAPLVSEEQFIALFRQHGATGTALRLGTSDRKVFERRRSIEARRGIAIESPNQIAARQVAKYPGRVEYTIQDGKIAIGSDPHYWPGIVSTAHRALVKFCEIEKPKAVIMNGDVVDGASISRHPPINWEDTPSVSQELETCKDRLGEITKAAGKARRFWPLGNHDARFESRLAQQVPEYADIEGMHLQDHFADWEPCWSVDVNQSLWVSHRYKGGVHAAYNNTLTAGRSTATGHLHKGVVTPFTDLNGTRYGIDLPTLAEPYGPQFDYQEDNPRNHRSGFAVLSFAGGKMLQPQLVLVVDETHVDYCGAVYEV